MAEHASGLKAVVVGATGAVGRELVAQLVASPRWASVACVGRRALSPAPAEPTADKLRQVVVDMDRLDSDPAAAVAFSGADSVFCALGTTRGAAGSAAAFRRVDLDYVTAATRAAAAAKAPHFSLVSAQGANPRIWASDLVPFHPLLYTKTKGQAEEAAKSQAFDYLTIMRPGLLDRGSLTRGVERMFARLASSVPVSGVAAVMVRDAERYHAAAAAAGGGGGARPTGVRVYEMKEIKKLAVEAVGQ